MGEGERGEGVGCDECTCSYVGTHGSSGEEQGEEAAPLAAWVAGTPHLRPGWHPARWCREAQGAGGRARGIARGEKSRPSPFPLLYSITWR